MHNDQSPPAAEHRFEPEQIAIKDADHTVTIAWHDGHVSLYPNWYLRGFCPCAVCQGHGGPLTFHGGDSGHGPDVDAVHEVGHYAINITWKDGHKTGIYTFQTLRNMCPCAHCSQTQVGQTLKKCLPQGRIDALCSAG